MVINIQPYLIDTNGYTGRLTAELTSGTSDLLASSHFGQPNNNVSIKLYKIMYLCDGHNGHTAISRSLF